MSVSLWELDHSLQPNWKTQFSLAPSTCPFSNNNILFYPAVLFNMKSFLIFCLKGQLKWWPLKMFTPSSVISTVGIFLVLAIVAVVFWLIIQLLSEYMQIQLWFVMYCFLFIFPHKARHSCIFRQLFKIYRISYSVTFRKFQWTTSISLQLYKRFIKTESSIEV